MPHPGSARRSALLLACTLACGVACAQPAREPSTTASAAERAQKETDRTMYWIRVLATKPAPAPPPAKAVPAQKPVVGSALAPIRPAGDPHDKSKASPAQTPGTATASNAPTPLAAAQGSTAAHAAGSTAPEPGAPGSRTTDGNGAALVNSDSASRQDIEPNAAAAADAGLIQVKSVQPEFPVAVVERIHKGHVEVRFEVEPSGKVVDAVVIQSSSPRLNSAAVEAIMQWQFKPTPASHTALVDLVFNIDKSN
jgi:protein TonB